MRSRPEAEALQREQRSRQAVVADIRQRRALATYSLLILIALAFGAEMIAGALEKPTELIRLGGNAPVLVREGQWWRLVTAGLLHASFLHLYMNGTALASIGLVVEKLIGSSRFLIIFLSASVMGHLASAWHASAMVSVGASAGIFGLLGALLVVQIVEHKNMPMALVVPPRRWVFLIGINVLISLMPGVDFWAHLGGFITGAALAAMLSADVDVQSPRGSAEVRVVAATVTLACCFAVAFALWRGAKTADLEDAIKSLGEVPWLHHDLPGFALQLPPGTEEKKQLDYGNGSSQVISLREGRTVVVGVIWKFIGGMAVDTSSMKEMAAIMAASQSGGTPSTFEFPGRDGAVVPAVEIVSERNTTDVALLHCGARLVTLTVVDNQSPKPWLQRLVASFKCQPDAAKEAELSRQTGFPLSLDLPGWYATAQYPAQVILSDGRKELLLLMQDGALGEDALKALLNAALRRAGMTMHSITQLTDRTTFGSSAGEQHAVGWYRQKNCGPARTIVVMGMAATAQEADDLFNITASAHCVAPGEAGQTWPNAPHQTPPSQ